MALDNTIKNYDKKMNFLSFMYYVYFITVVFSQFFSTTLFEWTTNLKFVDLFSDVLAIFVFVKIGMEWKKKWDISTVLMAVLCVIPFVCSNLNFSINYIMQLCIVILGAKGLKPKKLIGIYTIAVAAFTIFTVGSSALGYVHNLTVYREGSTQARYSLGFGYATYLSAHIMSVCIGWVYARDKKISWVELALIGAIGVVTYKLTDARFASFVIVMACLIYAINKFCAKKDKKLKIFENKFISRILVFWGAIMAAMSVVLGLLYNPNNAFWAKLNDILSQRLYYTWVAFNRYSLTPLGQRLIINANYDEGQEGLIKNFFIINNSYISVLISWGLICLISMLIIWALISYKEHKNKNYAALTLFFIIESFFFFEQRIMEISIIPFAVLLLSGEDADFFGIKEWKIAERLKPKKKIIYGILSMVIVAAVIEGTVFNLKALMSISYKKFTTEDCVFSSDGVALNDCMYEADNDNNEIYLTCSNLYTNTGLETVLVGINMYTIDDFDHYKRLENLEYTVEVYIYGGGGYYPLMGRVCNTSDSSTWYIPATDDAIVQSLLIKVILPEDVQFELLKLEFNGPIPFGFNGLRFILVWLGLSVISVVVILIKDKKDNEPKNEADKKEEMQA